ncbi:HNH endonuclease [Telmatospirillum sp. J64-1]|uniref:HNH endonuclease n=1 Tax=Telmatospirillum sp. J64-1 TaxID=2502183 RepID=UPI00115D60B2|nr:HNH endonuclease [Telmatospirillum sp. J64-1]
MRRRLREPIPEIFVAAELLQNAVDHHLSGDRAAAAAFFRAANIKAVWEWTDSVWGKHRPDIHTLFKIEGAPPYLPPEARVKSRMPNAAEEQRLIEHWGYRCAFCGIPLVHTRVRKRAVKAYPDAVSWGNQNILQHAAFMALWMQFDHILPHARGGDNSFENIVVTCAACNFGRMNYTLEEMGLEDPRRRPVERTDWNGLEHFK